MNCNNLKNFFIKIIIPRRSFTSTTIPRRSFTNTVIPRLDRGTQTFRPAEGHLKLKKTLLTLLLTLLPCLSLALDIYGHRGARGLAPENTLSAYQTALSLGVDVVDMDIGMTKDGVLVVTHNYALNPDLTRDKNGRYIRRKTLLIKNLTLTQLKQYDVGQLKPGTRYAALFPEQRAVPGTPIPTLKEVVDYVKKTAGHKARFQIEVKTTPEHPNWTASPESFAKKLAAFLEKESIVYVTEVQAFDWRVLRALQKINPDIITVYLTDQKTTENMHSSNPKRAGRWSAGYLLKDFNNSLPQMIKALGGNIWGPQDVEVTKALVKESHALGLKVIPWTWPEDTGKEIDPEEIKRLIDANVDGIITDRPDVLCKLSAL